MRIDEYRCVACGNCVPVCPVGAIYIDPVKNRATVNADECVECYTCFHGLSAEHLLPSDGARHPPGGPGVPVPLRSRA